jgi:hypothetical protein
VIEPIIFNNGFLVNKKSFSRGSARERKFRRIELVKIKSCIILKSLVLFEWKTAEVSFEKSIRDIAQFGRAPALGAGGRRFKSYYPESYFWTIRKGFLGSFGSKGKKIQFHLKKLSKLLIEFYLFFIIIVFYCY